MSMSGDLWTVKGAIEELPASCRFHGDDFGRLGYEGPHGVPRCESCRAPWRRMCALAAVQRMRDALEPAAPPAAPDGQCYCGGCIGMGPCDDDLGRADDDAADDIGPPSGDCCDGETGTPGVDCDCSWRS